jgi:hypothetical protein
MIENNDKWMIWCALSQYFKSDLDKFIVPKVPFTDGLGRKRLIDFAVLSRVADTPKVAIFILSDNNRTEEREKELAAHLLRQQGWLTFLFSAEEMLVDFETRVRPQLKKLADMERIVSLRNNCVFYYYSSAYRRRFAKSDRSGTRQQSSR